ncbi:hypothetical protein BFW86_28580 [Pseudomonas fluorescens]|nr:hypothetical protein BFW86_28580 [Pseudomonas fluorescens]
MPNDATPQTNHTNNNRPSTAYGLLTQLTTGPTMREVAANVLRAALMEQYPTLNLNPDLTQVVTPRWRVSADAIEPAEPLAESLTTVLARQALAPGPLIYLEGEHFLTLQPDTTPAVHLPVKIDAIARLINELSTLLYSAFQEQQLDYWNTSYNSAGLRWKVFAHALRKIWNVTTVEGWDADDCAIARGLYLAPDLADRTLNDPYQSHAYLIDIDLRLSNRLEHRAMLDTAVLVGQHKGRQIILAYSLIAGYERFDSMEQLSTSLLEKVSYLGTDANLQWRLYEPEGNVFESQACAMIALQIEAIASLGSDVAQSQVEPSVRRPTVARIMPSVEDLSEHRLSNIRDIHQRLPAWLTAASDLEIAAYSRLMIDLAQLHTHHHGRTFNSDIPPIRDYTRQQLQGQIKTHPNGADLVVDKIEVVIQTPVTWGFILVPDAKDITRRDLVGLALENLTGLPSGATNVIYNDADAPEWLSYDYLKGVIENLDIGARYPALIQQKLQKDPLESLQRQTLYTSHLRIQLPLLALQLKMQRRNGIDEFGVLYVTAAMQNQGHERRIDGQSAVIRPLSLIPTLRPGHRQDVVANMFVIGPNDHTAGPCVLYRPLLEPILWQFPSRQNLIYTIKHDPALRESVLAWLPEAERFNYAQYVFPETLPSPWTAVRVLVEPATVLYMNGPIELGDEVLTGDVLATLFKTNASTLIELATRQSVSNAQKRWDSLRNAGWQIFNAALPFLGRTVGIAAWIWQIMDDLEEAEHVIDTPQAQAPWTALVDMFLNLGMALALHVALRHPPREAIAKTREPLAETEFDLGEATKEKPAPAIKTISITQQPDVPNRELPALHQGPLNVNGALSSTSAALSATLDSFALAKPEGLGTPGKTAGVYSHLYPLAERWYAPVGQRWFEVTLDANDNVLIVDPTQPSRTGPLLVSNKAGQWFIDTRLRLRGGGLRNRRRAAQERKPSRIVALRENLNAFNADEERAQAQLSNALSAIGSEPGPSTDLRREAFIGQVDERLGAYDAPIRQLRALGIIDNVPNYQSTMVDYLNKQLVLTRTAVNERLEPFRDLMERTVEALESERPAAPQARAEQARAMSNMNDEIIRRMEYVESRFRELGDLGAAGAQVIQSTLKLMPKIKVPDLKALQITIARHLCTTTAEGEEPNSVRRQLDDIVDEVDLSVQSFIDISDKTNGGPLEQRIEALNSLVEQFALGDQRLLDLHADYPQHLLREPLERLRQLIDEFHQRATQELVQRLRERKALEPKPGPSSLPVTPQRKIIKTRFKGVVVGEPRTSDSSLVDIKAPMTGKIIATFHEKTPGVWVERDTPSEQPPSPEKVDLNTSLNAGQLLIDQEPAVTRRIQGHSRKAGRIPVEIEEMFYQHATKLERAANAIETALTQRNLTESDRPPAAALNRKLSESAARLFALGKSTRIHMTKQQPPTAARLEWLHNEGQVVINKTVTRRRLKGPEKNYLDEYEIRDVQDNAVLWYAHFHYPSPKVAAQEFAAAHLKNRDQQKLGGAVERRGSTDRDQIAIYRSEISPTLAKSLFFRG